MNSRRDFLGLLPAAAAFAAGAKTDEHAPDNLKIATLIDATKASDDDLLFLKQIGLRWVHASFGVDAPYEVIRAAQERLARFGLKIHCAMSDTYRSLRIQLGQPGRDEDIARFQTFVRDLGRLGI